jgi:hypothetical protein
MGDISKEVASTLKLAKNKYKKIVRRNDFFYIGYTYITSGIETSSLIRSGIRRSGLRSSGLRYFSLDKNSL